MPTVEDYYEDDPEDSLPSSSKPRNLAGQGLRGALLEEINSDDDADAPDPDDMALDDMDMDYGKLADQGRGIFGENARAPPPSAAGYEGKGKLAVRDDPGDLRPSGGAAPGMPGFNPNTPMGGFMGDMMKLQKAEEERLERVRKQFGNVKVADPEVYKGWNSVYPLYFDAKVSIADGRRVARKDSLWWPQAQQISKACRTLGLPCVLEVDTTHPADWENPGRVKVQFAANGRFLNPIIKNRSQLYKQLASQIKQAHPELIYKPRPKVTAGGGDSSTAAGASSKRKVQKAKAGSKSGKAGGKSSAGGAKAQSIRPAVRLPSRPPRPAIIPAMDDRFPLHSPLAETGVAIAAIKRDLEAEKDAKKKGLLSGAGAEAGGKEDKMPKMKRVVVRGKR